ncbi:hypothetical protein [Pelagibacterium sp.]|uniref:hypothetical protein n=1 Tax=Pelagibacterium sp. TaxID=1967288 RepID=UPI003BABD6AF
MTLVVIWRQDNALNSIADTRVTNCDTLVLTDFAPKLFLIKVHCETGPINHRHSHEFTIGFAFAGYVSAATYVHAAASAACSNLVAEEAIAPPPLKNIAELVRQIYERIVLDMHFRRPRDAQLVLNSSVLVFGYCPVSEELQSFQIKSGIVAGLPIVAMTARKVDDRHCVALGSGSRAFYAAASQMEESGVVDPIRAFLAVHRDPEVKDVGGGIQYLKADRSCAILPPVLNIDPAIDPDHPSYSLFGVNVESLGGVAGYKVGHQRPGSVVYGFGLEDAINRTMLRRLEVDPDGLEVTARLKNAAAIFGAVAAAAREKAKVRLDKAVDVQSVPLVPGQRYAGHPCPECGEFLRLLPDTGDFMLLEIWEGDGPFVGHCSCGCRFAFSPKEIDSQATAL